MMPQYHLPDSPLRLCYSIIPHSLSVTFLYTLLVPIHYSLKTMIPLKSSGPLGDEQ